jgi:putative transposase
VVRRSAEISVGWDSIPQREYFVGECFLMSDYRRVFIPGGTFFFTVVTFNRRPILTSDLSREILKHAWETIQEKHPFQCDAACLLPDHLHCLWTLPENDADYSLRWAAIKALFSKGYLHAIGDGSISRKRKGEVSIWQRRYWEHAIRDERDYARHFDYIHYNPVKHGLVKNVSEWKWSSFHKYKAKGFYSGDWGGSGDAFYLDGEFGE